MKKFVIYTARFGEPGRFNFPEVSIKRVDRICYTDLRVLPGCGTSIPVRKGKFKLNDFYDMRKIKANQKNSIMQQRFMKIIIPEEIFNNYEYSAYVDCKRPIRIDFEDCVRQLKDGSDFLTRKHPARDCVYDEARFCINKDGTKGSVCDIEKQVDHYKKRGYPEHNGLYLTSWVFRRHTEKVKWLSEFWWDQLVRFSHRDQISLPYVAWKHNMDIRT